MNRSASRDWIAFWYEVARERGQNHISSMGRGLLQNPTSGETSPVEYHDFTHIDEDGISAVNKTLQKLGNTTETWPLAKSPRRYSRRESWLAAKSASKLSAGRNARWKTLETSAPIEKALHDYSTLSFDVVQTATLKASCQRHKTSLNVVIALELDRLSRTLLKDPGQDTKWLFPVNIRGFLSRDVKSPNQVSYLPLLLKNRMSPEELKNQIRTQFKSDVPWGNWCLYNIGQIIGERGVRYLSKRASTRSFWMGTISDMGEWNTDGAYQSLGANEIWFAAPPGSINYPIGMTHLTFNGRLSLSLKIHPALKVSAESRRQLLGTLRDHLLKLSKS